MNTYKYNNGKFIISEGYGSLKSSLNEEAAETATNTIYGQLSASAGISDPAQINAIMQGIKEWGISDEGLTWKPDAFKEPTPVSSVVARDTASVVTRDTASLVTTHTGTLHEQKIIRHISLIPYRR